MKNLYLPFVQHSKQSFKALLSGLVLALVPLVAQSQVDISSVNGYAYKQDFNSLPQTGVVTLPLSTVPGWQVANSASTVFVADNGLNTVAGHYNYGSLGSSDRSLGYMASGNNSVNYEFAMKNTTASAVKYFKVTYRAEVWRKNVGSTTPIVFSYKTTSKASTAVQELNIDPYIVDGGGAINGNVKYFEKSFIIKNVELLSGGTIWFDWKLNSKWGISIDDITIEPLNVISEFYNKPGAELSELVSWGENPDGSGDAPLNFSNPNQVFHVSNYTSKAPPKLVKLWALTGAGSKVIIGNGTDAVALTFADNKTLTQGLVDLADNATLVVDAITNPQFGQLATNSTVVFGINNSGQVNQDVAFGKVVFETGKHNKISKKIKVKGTLELRDSKLELGDNDLELDYNAQLTGSAINYVVVNGKGRLRKALQAGEEVILPVGGATYNPVKLKLATNATPDVFSVSIVEGVYSSYLNDVPQVALPILSNIVNKTWIISEDVKGGSDLTMTLSWGKDDVLPGFDPAKSYVQHFEFGVWDQVPAQKASFDGVNYSVTRSGIKSFSPYGVNSGEMQVLPVSLLNFTAKATKPNTVELAWATASEQGNDFFAVERSADGKVFTEIAQVKGAGTSSVQQNYTFTDNAALAGVSYYRLRQVDQDGNYDHLPVRSVSNKATQAFSLSLYPNPAQGTDVSLQVQGLTQEGTLYVTDLMGKSVFERQLQAQGSAVLPTNTLKAGVYLVTVSGKGGTQTQRLVIK